MDCLKSAACGFVGMYDTLCVSTSFQIALNFLNKGISKELLGCSKQGEKNFSQNQL